MPLPPIKIADAVQKAAYDDLAKGAMKQFGDAIAVMVTRVLDPHRKSAEELALDWQIGEEVSANRRRLAAEALDRVPPERRILPAPQIAGRIFRESAFELPNTPIWEMWSQLLSRTSDSARVSVAHPAFPGIIGQLSTNEANLLSLLVTLYAHQEIRYSNLTWQDRSDIHVDTELAPEWQERAAHISDLHFAAAHLTQMGLTVLSASSGQHSRHGEIGTVTHGQSCRLTWWGRQFMHAVSIPEITPV